LLQLAFNPGDQLLPLPIYLILRIEKKASFLVALRFQGFDLFLADQLFLQRQRSRSGATGFLDLAFQTHFEVIGPTIQLYGFGFEKAGVALGYLFLDCDLPLLQSRPQGAVCPTARDGSYKISRQAEQSGRGFGIHRMFIISDGREYEVILGLIKGLDGVDLSFQPTGLADERFQDRHLAVVAAIVEPDFGRRQGGPTFWAGTLPSRTSL